MKDMVDLVIMPTLVCCDCGVFEASSCDELKLRYSVLTMCRGRHSLGGGECYAHGRYCPRIDPFIGV